MRVGSWSSALPEEDQPTQVGGSPKVGRKRGTAGESRRFAAGRAEDTKPIRAGELATGRAGVQAVDASRRLCAGAARGRDNQRELESRPQG